MDRKMLVIIAEDELDLADIKRKITSMLYAYNINFNEENGMIELKNTLIDFKIKNEPINYKEYDSISAYQLNENLGTLMNLLKEEKDIGSN